MASVPTLGGLTFSGAFSVRATQAAGTHFTFERSTGWKRSRVSLTVGKHASIPADPHDVLYSARIPAAWVARTASAKAGPRVRVGTLTRTAAAAKASQGCDDDVAVKIRYLYFINAKKKIINGLPLFFRSGQQKYLRQNGITQNEKIKSL